MRVAVIADIHANVPAMEAVLDDIRIQAPDEILHAGDLVGRGPQGSRVATRIRELGWRGVRGNHEDYLIDFRRGRVEPEWLRADEWAAARWMAGELSNEDLDYLDALPLELHSASEPELSIVHGSPLSQAEGLGPWSTDDELHAHLHRVNGGVLVCGHTHRPMLRELEAGLVVNVGAVGLPFNRDRRAQYAILDHAQGKWHVTFRQIDYPVARTLGIYDATGFTERGGVTARLLRLELEHATPFLVPFIKWSHVLGRPRGAEDCEAFLAFFDPAESMSVFARKLEALRAR